MATADTHEWLHHWQDEADAAFLYLALAGQEPDPGRKDVYIKLAGVEERHVQMWEKLLREHGHEVGRARPSFNARVRAWAGRRFGSRFLLPLLLREEGQEVKGYLSLHRTSQLQDAQDVSLQLAKESAAHALAVEVNSIPCDPPALAFITPSMAGTPHSMEFPAN